MEILAKINLGKNMLRQEQHFFALKNLYLYTKIRRTHLFNTMSEGVSKFLHRCKSCGSFEKEAIIAHVIDGRMP